MGKKKRPAAYELAIDLRITLLVTGDESEFMVDRSVVEDGASQYVRELLRTGDETLLKSVESIKTGHFFDSRYWHPEELAIGGEKYGSPAFGKRRIPKGIEVPLSTVLKDTVIL